MNKFARAFLLDGATAIGELLQRLWLLIQFVDGCVGQRRMGSKKDGAS
jgi:hypothetical protein